MIFNGLGCLDARTRSIFGKWRISYLSGTIFQLMGLTALAIEQQKSSVSQKSHSPSNGETL